MDKQYCGIGKTRMIGEGESSYQILKVSFSPEHLEILNNWAKDNNGWTTINIGKRRTPSDKGITHTVSLDTWKPEQKTQQQNIDNIQASFEGREIPF